MYNIVLESSNGDILNVSRSDKYILTDVKGLTPTKADINTTASANIDGSVFNSARLTQRNIVIEFYLANDAESNRINLYKYIKVKKPIKVNITTSFRNVSIEGYVESLDVSIFGQKVKGQISIICPNPFFSDGESEVINFSYVNDGFEFPFSIESAGVSFGEIIRILEFNIYNDSDVDVGMDIIFKAKGANVENPSLMNNDTLTGIEYDGIIPDGGILRINTRKGKKSATLEVNGVITNVINNINTINTFEWLKLYTGDNLLTYTAEENIDYLECTVNYETLYDGV